MLKNKGIIAKLKVENENLVKTRIELENNVKNMQVKMNEMKKKDRSLHDTFVRFKDSQQKLNDIMELQKAFFNEEGLGYDFTQKETHLKNFLVKDNEIISQPRIKNLDRSTISRMGYTKNVETKRLVHKRERQSEGDGNDNDDEDMPQQASIEPSSSVMPFSLVGHMSTDARIDAMREMLEENEW
ncbi:Uncharacterized protein TCM_039890 [Theobroma cacao]|uniref:Uncharacterized protein n=1 Tax=Theobroma cacao TaxID=3641 RepID=A0A061GRX7_THECC|nr:Uncharacterized protein TCM_039890 [Theobroma cacao]